MVKRTAARWTTWKSKAANWYLSCGDQTWLAGNPWSKCRFEWENHVYIYICVNKWGMHFYSSTPRNKCRCLFQDAAVAATSMMFFPALGSLFGADLLWVCSTAANHQANITFWNILNVKTCKKKLYIWTWNQATIGWRDILWSEGLIPAPDGYDYYWWLCQNLRKGFFLWKKDPMLQT